LELKDFREEAKGRGESVDAVCACIFLQRSSFAHQDFPGSIQSIFPRRNPKNSPKMNFQVCHGGISATRRKKFDAC